jgi:hypothetical protein
LKTQVRLYKGVAVATKKAVDKKEKQDAKDKARDNKVSGNNGQHVFISNLGKQLADALEKDGVPADDFVNCCWNVKTDMMECETATAVVVPKERCADAAKDLVKLEYYRQQKEWVQEVMKTSGLHHAAAAVVKVQVVKKVQSLIKKFDTELKPREGAPREIEDVYAPQFFQNKAGTHKVQCSTDHSLIECLLGLEGEQMVYGYPHSKLRGATLPEKEVSLWKMNHNEFHKRVAADGFAFKLQPGSCVAVPGNYAVAVVVLAKEDCHGLRWHIHGSAQRITDTVKYLDLLLKEKPELASGTVGKVKADLDAKLQG